MSAPDGSSPLVELAPRDRARQLSGVVLVGMTVASALGVFVPGLYRDPAEVVAMLRGYDLVTLAVAAPLLVGALLPAFRGSVRAAVLRQSMLCYAVYHYATYVFGGAFNAAFLLHVGVVVAALAGLVLGFVTLDVAATAAQLRARTPARLVAVILALLALGLGGIWVVQSVLFAVTGEAPTGSLLVVPPEHLHLAFALDLVLLVPAYAAAAVLLWRGRDWGSVLGGALLPFSVVYQVSYMVALAFQARAGVAGATAFDPAEPVIVVLVVVATALVFRGGPPDVRSLPASPPEPAPEPALVQPEGGSATVR